MPHVGKELQDNISLESLFQTNSFIKTKMVALYLASLHTRIHFHNLLSLKQKVKCSILTALLILSQDRPEKVFSTT